MLPILNNTARKSKKYVVAFRGINYGEGYQDGELSESRNISADLYPCVGPRFARVAAGQYDSPTSLHTKDGLLVICGTNVMYNGKKVGTVTAGRKQMATIGNYVVIFPDKKYFHVESGKMGDMEAPVTLLKVNFESGGIAKTNYQWPFSVGDSVEISGCVEYERNNKTAVIRSIDENGLWFDDGVFDAGTEYSEVTVRRPIPDLDFICESNYRLWGTHGNTIYGSKYGNPFSFNTFDGLSGDSYYIDVGTDGAFTGCIAFGSHVCFFKENTLHKLYGSKPSNFQIVTSQVYGVQAGSERSMCIINETLYYKGVHGIYAYTGGVPELVSEKLGGRRYADACAASDGILYYICMRDDAGWNLFAYDAEKNIWVREDDLECVDMTAYGGYVYLLARDGALYRVDGMADRSDIEWSITFCPFCETINERKGYSRFHLRLDLAAGAWLQADIKRNTDTRWQTVYTTHNHRAQTVSIPILPARCDSVEIRLRGKGECVLRTFIREFFTGSDV